MHEIVKRDEVSNAPNFDISVTTQFSMKTIPCRTKSPTDLLAES